MSEEQQDEGQEQAVETEEVEAVVEGEIADAEVSANEDDPHLLLEDARNKADEHWNLYMRTQAEMDNLRKRAERDVQNAHKFGVEKLITELLPVVDSIEMGMAAADSSDEATARLVEGMEMTVKMFADALQKVGIVQIDPMGDVFNPEFHQAMSMVENPDAEPNTVMAVMQKGYVLNERLVRPAMVVVVKAPAAKEE
ncbi:MAG: nucleotide exchange factor GrpE [Sulfuriflexus sp.]|nr:nucleotide exchange factor GrpE [Sulfuriflexus sp.]